MRRFLRLLGAVSSAGILIFTGCDGEANAGSSRKGFFTIENQLRTRLQFYYAYNQDYPESLYELDDPGIYEVPDPPQGYYYDYDRKYGIVKIRPLSEKEEEDE